MEVGPREEILHSQNILFSPAILSNLPKLLHLEAEHRRKTREKKKRTRKIKWETQSIYLSFLKWRLSPTLGNIKSYKRKTPSSQTLGLSQMCWHSETIPALQLKCLASISQHPAPSYSSKVNVPSSMSLSLILQSLEMRDVIVCWVRAHTESRHSVFTSQQCYLASVQSWGAFPWTPLAYC